MFRGYDDAVKTVGSIDESAYKCVYDGYIRAGTLEDIYDQLNSEHPIGYNGHSLSVSDVVYIPENEECISSGCYYCDTFGFKRLETFDISKIQDYDSDDEIVEVEPEVEFPNTIAIDFSNDKLSLAGAMEVGGIYDVNFSISCKKTDKGGIFNTIR